MSGPDPIPAGRRRRPRKEGRDAISVQAGPVTIFVAAHAGYCYGVERALLITERALTREERPIATLGPLIHNPAVIEELAGRGVEVASDVDDVAGGTLVLRTHGVPPSVVERARERGLTVIDATCPFVTVAQRRAADLSRRGYTVVVLGEREHPEVVGLAACAGPDALIVDDPARLDLGLVTGRRVGIVVQTTQTREDLSHLVAKVSALAKETLVYNTVCEATERRQEAGRELAADVDVVIVIGGHNSANTRRLAQICAAIQRQTHVVQRPDEILPEWLEGARRVGVTAGASTPDADIDAAVEGIRRLFSDD
jgi:4-hydroxy-3-methylbut-2-en-1-yl diphosphate reductase